MATIAQGTPSTAEEVNYLNVEHGWKSWLFTTDHKRIAVLYIISITLMFFVGGLFAVMMRVNLLSPEGNYFSAATYDRLFSMHGIIMVFFFLVPSIPATLANFLIPIMIGAKDPAFPRVNLLSWYLYVIGAIVTMYCVFVGGVDTGWTFYAPFSSTYSNSYVLPAVAGVFVAGFSSILTGLNFIVTVHKMRAPGMTWGRLPLFVWSNYATGARHSRTGHFPNTNRI
jgi:cytochrome c oxidase subunit I